MSTLAVGYADWIDRIVRDLNITAPIAYRWQPGLSRNGRAKRFINAHTEQVRYVVMVNPASRSFSVRRVLAHELRHVWQYEQGYLRKLQGFWAEWRGQPILWNHGNRDDQPWEVDARAYADHMVDGIPRPEIT